MIARKVASTTARRSRPLRLAQDPATTPLTLYRSRCPCTHMPVRFLSSPLHHHLSTTSRHHCSSSSRGGSNRSTGPRGWPSRTMVTEVSNLSARPSLCACTHSAARRTPSRHQTSLPALVPPCHPPWRGTGSLSSRRAFPAPRPLPCPQHEPPRVAHPLVAERRRPPAASQSGWGGRTLPQCPIRGRP